MNEWPGLAQARVSRQWPVLEEIVDRASGIAAVEGVIAIGSFASGDVDPLSDLDLIVVTYPDRLDEAWAARFELTGEPLVAWESRTDDDDERIRWFNWLTRDLVKVECGFAPYGSKELAEPFAVLLGERTLAERLPRTDPATVQARAALLCERQREFDPGDMTPGERVAWRLAELKQAVRSAQRNG